MAHKIDKHYSDLGGVNTSANKMSQDPKTARQGSLNFQYSDGVTSDEIAKRKGFQHKSVTTYGAECGLFEYKFKDIDTGEASTIILGVGRDGNLRKKINVTLVLTKASGSADTYSFYYNGTNWIFNIYNSAGTSLGSVTCTISTTLNSLVTSINALAISGLTASLVDDSGTATTSTLTCYLLDVVISKSIPVGTVSNSVFDWELVPYANLDYANANINSGDVPFKEARDGYLDEAWKGCSATNLNNVCYITSGGFLMKYDGRAVYRAGMPRFTNDLGVLGNTFIPVATGALTPSRNYKYIFQFGHVDVNGLEVLGLISETDYFEAVTGGSDLGFEIPIDPIGGTDATNSIFPIFSCQVNGTQTFAGTGSKVLTVESGHNIKVGMCLRVIVSNNANPTFTSEGMSFAYYEVTAVAATTVTFNKTLSTHLALPGIAGFPLSLENSSGSGNNDDFYDELVIQGCYVPENVVGTVTEPTSSYTNGIVQAWAPTPIYGAFVRIYRSVGSTTAFGTSAINVEPMYRLADMAISHQNTYTIIDRLADSTLADGAEKSLTRIPIDYSLGEEIPRACAFVSQFQQQIIQGGRPYAPLTILKDPAEILPKYYPWYYKPSIRPTVGNKWGYEIYDAPFIYNESNLCDFQSIYWSDSIAFEGFPTSGANEESFESDFADQVNGAKENKEGLFVFKDRTTGILTGTLATGDLTKEILEADVGCLNQGALAEVNGFVMFLDPIKGFHAVVAGRLPVAIGQPIMDQFKANGTKSRLTRLNLNRAQATDFKADDKYICYIPGGWNDLGDEQANPYPTSSSLFFAFDYSMKDLKSARNCWYFWNSASNILNGCGGVLGTSDGDLLLGGLESGSTQIVWKQKFTETVYDYSDHISAVPFVFNTSWLTYGERSIDKHFVQIAINSITGGFILTVKQYVDWVDTLIGSIDVTFSSSSTKVKPKQMVKCNQPKASAYSLGFENSTINQDVRIDGFDIELSADFDLTEIKR